ncbi:metal ABC transporter permease [Ktedonospora formicarum]|uniref:ABC transporter permease n=1 Tax=Ktedonospora formicarum TaxID=2778364 RepID=A0A8J3I6K7_9CHLR|nr:metal ABC transporter permease [Ktedonospora formicarum]GHO46803.1 ABC transporter permease [Ktedonospora formicarum]
MSTLLELFQLYQNQEFVRNAFLAGTMVAIVTAIVGYFVVLRSQAFAGHALSHVGFAGATGAALLGLSSLTGMFALTLLAALGMGALDKRLQGRDIETGIVLSFALGLGVLFLNIYTQYATQTVGVLFGSLWSVSHNDMLVTLIVGLIVIGVLALIFRPLLFSSIDPEVAQARGIPVRLLSVIFLLLIAVTVTEAVQVVGVLLVFALLIVPAAIARQLTNRPLVALWLTLLLGLAFTWIGLLLGLLGHWPVGFYISALAALSYFTVTGFKRLRPPTRYQNMPHPNRECD